MFVDALSVQGNFECNAVGPEQLLCQLVDYWK